MLAYKKRPNYEKKYSLNERIEPKNDETDIRIKGLESQLKLEAKYSNDLFKANESLKK